MVQQRNRQESDIFSTMTEAERSEVARKILPRRKELRMTREQLHEMSDVSVRTIGSVERGETVPQADVLRRLATALDLGPGVSLDDDVERWLALVGPLLQEMSRGQRARVMQDLLPRLVSALKADPGDDNARIMDVLG